MIDLARPGDIRDVDHTIQAVFQLDESTVAGEVANLAFDVAAGRIPVQGPIPGVTFQLADSKGDLLLFTVDPEDDRFDFLIGLENIRRFGDALGPGQLGDVDQTFNARFQFN